MKKTLPFISGIVVVLVMLFLLISLVSATGPDLDEGQPNAPHADTDETEPAQPLFLNSVTAINAPVTTVYFAPEDSGSTATYINLYNSGTISQTVNLQAFNLNGSLIMNMDIDIEAKHRLRGHSDPIAASPPPSWSSPNTFSANFTDSATVAMLQLPPGVKAQVYMVYNEGTDTVNPRAFQGAIPINLSSDPLTIFMPTIEN